MLLLSTRFHDSRLSVEIPDTDYLRILASYTIQYNTISYYMRMNVIQDLFIGQDQLTSHEAEGPVGCELVEPDK